MSKRRLVVILVEPDRGIKAPGGYWWELRYKGSETGFRDFETKNFAVKKAKEICEEKKPAKLIIKKRNGEIQKTIKYGYRNKEKVLPKLYLFYEPAVKGWVYKWHSRGELASRHSFNTKERALQKAKKLCKRNRPSTLVVSKKNGETQYKQKYGWY